MRITMGQLGLIMGSGVTLETGDLAWRQWLARRPLEVQRLASREIGSPAATALVAALSKNGHKGQREQS